MTHAGSSVGAWKLSEGVTRIASHTDLSKLLVAPLILRELKNSFV